MKVTVQDLEEAAANPLMAANTIGHVVLHMLRAGQDLSRESLVEQLTALSEGRVQIDVLSESSGKGALTLISKTHP